MSYNYQHIDTLCPVSDFHGIRNDGRFDLQSAIIEGPEMYLEITTG